MAGDENSPLVMKALGDHGKALLAEHLLGANHRVEGAESGEIHIDGGGGDARLDQGAAHLAWLVVLHGGVVTGDDDEVHLGIVVELGRRLDTVFEVVVGAATGEIFGGTQHHRNPVVGHLVHLIVGVVTGIRDDPLAVAQQHGNQGQQQNEAGEEDLGKLLHARCGQGLKLGVAIGILLQLGRWRQA